MADAYLESSLPGLTRRTGKVRDIYEFDDRLLFIATDRISAFDWVLSTGIPDKGRVLTQVSRFWFDRLDVANHVLSLDPTDAPLPDGTDVESLVGRSMVVRKTEVVYFIRSSIHLLPHFVRKKFIVLLRIIFANAR